MRKAVGLWGLALAGQVLVVAHQTEFSKNFIDVRTARWKGVVLARSCFQALGLDKAIEDVACSREAASRGLPLGILTDDDGFMTIVGDMAKDNSVEVIQYIGRRVDVAGTSAQPTGNYIPRQIDVTEMVLEKQ